MKAHGVLAAERAPVGRDREPLVVGQRAAAHRDRDRGAFESLAHLGLQVAHLTAARLCQVCDAKCRGARLPLASVVTTRTGPVCAERLAAELMPAIV